MSYQVLARRWRPKRFSEVVGQEHVTRTIQNALRQGRLAHAFLFTGPRGVGKTSTARILARAVNCRRIDLKGEAEPCNECETCKALFEDREMDVIEMDAASYRGIEDVRRINETARLAPVAGQKKIYIIDEVHMFTREAFNALLKTLEEPPSHVIFILATTDAHKVPATILSRVQRYDFRPVQPLDIVPHLAHICRHEKWEVEEQALWLMARRAEGSLRDAEGLLDQVVSFSGSPVTLTTTREVLGVLPGELLTQATRLIAARDPKAVPPYLEHLALHGVDYTELLKAIESYWMDLIFLKEGLAVPGRSAEETAQMTEAGVDLSVADLFRLIRLAEELEAAIKWSTVPRVRFEVSFLRWVTLDRVATIQHILERLGPGGASEPPAIRAATPSASAPAVKQADAQTESMFGDSKPAAVPAGGFTLDTLRARWPEVVAALSKRSPSASVMARSQLVLDRLDGKKLHLRPTVPGKFAADQLKAAAPHLTAAISEIFGVDVMLVPGAATSGQATQAAPTPPKTEPASGDRDLFGRVANRFGGVEVDPKSVREPE